MFVFPGTTTAFNGNSDTAIRAGYVYVTDSDYQQLCDGFMVWQDGVLVEVSSETKSTLQAIKTQRAYETSKRDEIAACKRELYKLDIKTMKFIDGDITEEQYEPFKLRKAELRIRIREIEAELGDV